MIYYRCIRLQSALGIQIFTPTKNIDHWGKKKQQETYVINNRNTLISLHIAIY